MSAEMPAEPRRSLVSLVVVHGIGAQRRAEALLEWAEPLLRHIDALSLGGGGTGVQFGRVDLAPDGRETVSARAGFAAPGGEPREVILTVTEARWSESFLSLTTGETFRWGAVFVWRAVVRLGAHFTRVLWQNPFWRVASTVVVAALWALLAALAAVVTVLLPVLSVLLLVPVLRAALVTATGALAEFVGDLAAWTRRPVRAAAMRAVVRDAVVDARLRLSDDSRRLGLDERAARLVVLAHSQGASIAAETLFSARTGEPRPPVDAFVSVGAAVTLLGSPRWTTGSMERWRMMLAGAGRGTPSFTPVADWAALPHPPRWLNIWALWDPFTAGPLSTSVPESAARWRELFRERRGSDTARGPEEHPVHNGAWPLTDHSTYAGNVAQVVDPVARLLLGIDRPVGDAPARRTPAATRAASAHVESVRQLGTNRLLAMALAAASPFAQAVVPALDGWPRVLAAIALGVVALWANGSLWRRYVWQLEWRAIDGAPILPWVSGLALRVALCAALAVLAILAVPGAWVPVVAALAAVLVVVAPHLGRRPHPLAERR
jgi:hypothetical protein